MAHAVATLSISTPTNPWTAKLVEGVTTVLLIFIGILGYRTWLARRAQGKFLGAEPSS